MAKKSFENMNTDKVYSAIEQGTSRRGQQGTASPQEAKDRADNLRTQGRKGCKAFRINMAFTPDNHSFIKIMAKASGKTMTEMCNLIIAAYRREHPEILEEAQHFLDIVNSGKFSNLIDGGGTNGD